MAVRDDFASGEVLTATDLNDTFGSKLPYSYGTATPSTSDDGFLWFDSNVTPPTPKFWDGSEFVGLGGLSYITNVDVSSASTLNVNDVFTSDFNNYRVWISANMGSDAALRIQMRANGSSITSGYYSSYVQYRVDSDAFIWTRQDDGSYAATASTPGILRGFLDFSFPNSVTGSFSGQIVDTNSNHPALWGARLSATAADGISLVASTGTANFRIIVYGYQGF